MVGLHCLAQLSGITANSWCLDKFGPLPMVGTSCCCCLNRALFRYSTHTHTQADYHPPSRTNRHKHSPGQHIQTSRVKLGHWARCPVCSNRPWNLELRAVRLLAPIFSCRISSVSPQGFFMRFAHGPYLRILLQTPK